MSLDWFRAAWRAWRRDFVAMAEETDRGAELYFSERDPKTMTPEERELRDRYERSLM